MLKLFSFLFVVVLIKLSHDIKSFCWIPRAGLSLLLSVVACEAFWFFFSLTMTLLVDCYCGARNIKLSLTLILIRAAFKSSVYCRRAVLLDASNFYDTFVSNDNV